MTRTKSMWRFFLAYEDQKQEAWLEALALQGWNLSRPGLFRFIFTKGKPNTNRYRLDYEMLRGKQRDEYLVLFQDAGWDFLGEVTNRYYFKARSDAFSPEVFSDPESRRDRIRRELRLLGGILAIEGWNISILGAMGTRDFHRQDPFRDVLMPLGLGILLALLVVTVLTGWCVWKLARALKHGPDSH
jgi:hypothetical protein